MQHFWITKKTVQRKLGSREDEHIISSDAELDAKIEIFKSISDTSTELCKIIDNYQEHIVILSQEESIFGRFLKEAGKRSKTTGQSILNTGKSVSYCGQQRMCVRVPLLRLQHEVDIFRNRAVSDTQTTITAMEKERTEYRAALEWMKSSSAELDPDTGRGVDKFRTAQSHVRAAKQNFDTLSMDSIQKIDLLAAARCNMFSHVLVSYMTELKQFGQKTTATFDTISKALEQRPKYDFCVLKELTQHEEVQDKISNNISSFDNDQTLFFASDQTKSDLCGTIITYIYIIHQQSDYTDSNEENHHTADIQKNVDDETDVSLIELCKNDNVLDLCNIRENTDIVALQTTNYNKNFIESNNLMSKVFGNNTKISTTLKTQKKSMDTKVSTSSISQGERSRPTKSLKQNSWIELFADLDPLANLQAFDMKLSGGCKSSQQT